MKRGLEFWVSRVNVGGGLRGRGEVVRGRGGSGRGVRSGASVVEGGGAVNGTASRGGSFIQ